MVPKELEPWFYLKNLDFWDGSNFEPSYKLNYLIINIYIALFLGQVGPTLKTPFFEGFLF